MSTAPVPSEKDMNGWSDGGGDVVALCLKQKLLPVDGESGVVFPATYADIGYSIDTFPDGTSVAQIDSVGSQANRMEPLFKGPPLSGLVPAVTITVPEKDLKRMVSLFDVGHRLADALLRSTEGRAQVTDAFSAYIGGNATPMAKLAPTSIVFGAWDSRGAGAKLPRVVQAVIRAYDVRTLHRAAQYVPPVDYAAAGVISEQEKVAAEAGEKSPDAQRGFVHVPAVWRNEAHTERVLGGVIANGGIWREVNVNLIVIRALRGSGDEDGSRLRRYILGLALAVVAQPQENFLRQGCILTEDPALPAVWELVYRDGTRTQVSIKAEVALAYATQAARAFGVGGERDFTFDPKLAMADRDEAGTRKAKKAKGAKAAGASGDAAPEPQEAES